MPNVFYNWESQPQKRTRRRFCPDHPGRPVYKNRAVCYECLRKRYREEYSRKANPRYSSDDDTDPFRVMTSLRPEDPAECPFCHDKFPERRLMWAHRRDGGEYLCPKMNPLYLQSPTEPSPRESSG